MSGPILPLKTALRATLVSDATVVGLIGGPRVYDEVPRGQEPPYLAFGDATTRENGSSSGRGHSTDMQIIAWSRQGGTGEALQIVERVEALLDDANPTLAGHRIVLMRVAETQLRFDPARSLARASLRLRILSEVL